MWESSEAKRLKMARGKKEGDVLDMKLFCQYFREKNITYSKIIEKLLQKLLCDF